MIFRICKKHNLLTSNKIQRKGKNYFLRISKSGFCELYKSSGPFSCAGKREWADLIIERKGIIGGYQVGKEKTTERILTALKDKDSMSIKDICIKCRLLPSTVREGIRKLLNENKIQRKKVGKSYFYHLF